MFLPKHKYLEEIGINDYYLSWNIRAQLREIKRFWTCGMACRETYDVDNSMLITLYERLVKFREESKNVILLNVPICDTPFTEAMLLDYLIESLKEVLLFDYNLCVRSLESLDQLYKESGITTSNYNALNNFIKTADNLGITVNHYSIIKKKYIWQLWSEYSYIFWW